LKHFSYIHQPIFTTLSEITDVDMVMNLQHLGSNLADMWSKSRCIRK